MSTPESKAPTTGLTHLLAGYKGLITLLVVLTVIANGFSVAIPKMIAVAIDSYVNGGFVLSHVIWLFGLVAALIFIFTYLQSVVQVYTSERVARDLRNNITAKVSVQPNSYIEKVTPAKLLTNLTSDVDAIKTFVSTAISSLIASAFLIVAVSLMLLITNWRLGLAVLAIMPLIGVVLIIVLSRVRKLFTQAQETIDWLNKVISESILGSILIRLLDAQTTEYDKFVAANTESRRVGFAILRLFASLIPLITFFTNLATLVIILLGGHFVIQGSMSLGNFTAFTSYLAILIFPILIIGFMTGLIAQARASYGRIAAVLEAPLEKETGERAAPLSGDITAEHITVTFGDKQALKDASFHIKPGSKTAIIGPTAAGKTQLLYVLTGLLAPTSGDVRYDGHPITEYSKASLHSQVGFVFQDSVMFNLTLRENIAFSNTVQDVNLAKAIDTAELHDFIDALPDKLDTMVSERGTSLSGGQKQRIMLARALALNPKVLLLDDFTARVDTQTEQSILRNIATNYPDVTLISVTQKISAIEQYDQILVLMEGELLASGTHAELLHTSPEYAQIFESQRSTNEYE